MRGKRRTSGRPQLLFSIRAPSLDLVQLIDGRKKEVRREEKRKGEER